MWAHGWGARRHRGLRVWVLQLLERGPLNGAELMDQMDRMTMGWWRPSPGSIYPLLEQLEQEKLVAKKEDGRYELTEKAKEGPDWMHHGGFREAVGPRDGADAIATIESYVRYLEDLSKQDRAKIADLADKIKSLTKRLDQLRP